MSKEKKLVPKLRFKEFEDLETWHQKDLGEMVIFFTGLTYSPSNIVEEKDTLVLRSSNVKNGEIVEADNVYVDSKIVNSDNVQVGDIIVVVRNGSRHLIGNNAQVKNQMENTVIGAFMTGIRSDIPEFINALLDTTQFQSEIHKDLGATINQITTGNFKTMKFNFPEKEEANKIGYLFKKIDNLILLQRKKINKTKNIKAAYLSEMFPKEGEKYPKQRFEGFKKPWVKEKLGNLLNYEQPTKYLVENDNYDDSYSTPVLTAGKSFILGYTDEIHGVYHANSQKGVIIFDDFTTSSHYVDFSFKVKSSAMKFLTAIQKDFNLYFLYNLLTTINYVPESHERHWISIFAEFDVLIPSREEQQKIADFFTNLDNQISIEVEKLAKLEKLKQGYLNDMFI